MKRNEMSIRTDVPLRLTGRSSVRGTLFTWRGTPRPGVVGVDLYTWTLTAQGRVPLRLNETPLPLADEWLDGREPVAPLFDGDPLEERLRGPSAKPMDRVPFFYVQAWVEFAMTGHSPSLRPPCPPEPAPPLAPGQYFLIDRYEDGREGAGTILEERVWTPELERDRDERIRRALEEIRRRGLTRDLPGNPTLEELERHLRGGIKGNKGELESDGRTFPGPKHPETGKGTSDVTVNGNAALDSEPEWLVAVVLHELVHVNQNLTRMIPEKLKDITIDRIQREVDAYNMIWDQIQNGNLNLRPGLQAKEAGEAAASIAKLYRQFAEILLDLEEALTD